MCGSYQLYTLFYDDVKCTITLIHSVNVTMPNDCSRHLMQSSKVLWTVDCLSKLPSWKFRRFRHSLLLAFLLELACTIWKFCNLKTMFQLEIFSIWKFPSMNSIFFFSSLWNSGLAVSKARPVQLKLFDAWISSFFPNFATSNLFFLRIFLHSKSEFKLLVSLSFSKFFGSKFLHRFQNALILKRKNLAKRSSQVDWTVQFEVSSLKLVCPKILRFLKIIY